MHQQLHVLCECEQKKTILISSSRRFLSNNQHNVQPGVFSTLSSSKLFLKKSISPLPLRRIVVIRKIEFLYKKSLEVFRIKGVRTPSFFEFESSLTPLFEIITSSTCKFLEFQLEHRTHRTITIFLAYCLTLTHLKRKKIDTVVEVIFTIINIIALIVTVAVDDEDDDQDRDHDTISSYRIDTKMRKNTMHITKVT